MIRWFNDGNRVGFEFDNPKEVTKLAKDKEAIDNFKNILSKIDDVRFNRVSDLTKSTIDGFNEANSTTFATKLAPINKKVSTSNNIAKAVLGVSVANLLLIAGDKGYELYKKFKSSKKPTIKK